MTSPYFGPRLAVGILFGLLVGSVAALIGFPIGIAVFLIGMTLIGRRDPSFLRARAVINEEAARRADRDEAAADAFERNQYWSRFPVQGIPGEPRNGCHLDRQFAPFSECAVGHYDHHNMGELFTRNGQGRIARSCAKAGCTCTWSELMTGGAR